jgi:multidrug efflux system membrane fusion protein
MSGSRAADPCRSHGKDAKVARLLNRALVYGVVAATTAIVAYVTVMPGVQKQAAGKRFKGGDGPVPVVDAPARIADVPIHLNGVGTARARNTVTVRPQVDGRILSIKFKEGQDVKRGDVLALIDPATYQAQLDQAIAKRALDEAQLVNAQRDLERYTSLGGNVIAQKTIDTQRALVAQLTAQIKLDDAAIASAKAFLDYTTIVAPIDGRTGIRMVDEGNLVRASDAGIVMITEVRPIAVIFTLPQQQLAQINAAQARGPVQVEALAPDGKTALDHGMLQVVDNQVDQATGTVRMKAEFPNASLQLWPGQFVNVRILAETLSQVVTIPTPAVQRGPSGTFAYVVQPDQRVSLRPITVSQQNETTAVVSKGIAAAERVVTTGFPRLKDGARVVLPDGSQPDGVARGRQAPVASAKSEGRENKSDAREKMRTACGDDIQKLCPGVERREIRACLRQNASKLSEACKAAAAAGQKGGQATGSNPPAIQTPAPGTARGNAQRALSREVDLRQADGSTTQ